jgi:putative tryptophan/tyrosine transport system substrate-binding protein
MRRREFIGLLGATAALSAPAWGQQRAHPTIGILYNQSPEVEEDFMPAFYRGLSELGYTAGNNVAFEFSSADGHPERQPALAADMVRRNVSLIIAQTGIFALAAKAATQTIPIIFMDGRDPVANGLVTSFNRPGGNVTGVALLATALTSKRFELLHQLVPSVQTSAMLVGLATNAPYIQDETREVQSAARALGVRVLVLSVPTESDIPAAFATLIEQRADALLLSASIGFRKAKARDQVLSLATRHAIPTMFSDSVSVARGALASYGLDWPEAYRQVGLYAGRILNGVNPADLPVVQPTKFNLMFNLKTAKALGIEIPPNLIALADQIIE